MGKWVRSPDTSVGQVTRYCLATNVGGDEGERHQLQVHVTDFFFFNDRGYSRNHQKLWGDTTATPCPFYLFYWKWREAGFFKKNSPTTLRATVGNKSRELGVPCSDQPYLWGIIPVSARMQPFSLGKLI